MKQIALVNLILANFIWSGCGGATMGGTTAWQNSTSTTSTSKTSGSTSGAASSSSTAPAATLTCTIAANSTSIAVGGVLGISLQITGGTLPVNNVQLWYGSANGVINYNGVALGPAGIAVPSSSSVYLWTLVNTVAAQTTQTFQLKISTSTGTAICTSNTLSVTLL